MGNGTRGPRTTGSIRVVALVGHAGTGKTALAEAMLFRAGAVSRLGRVEDGTTTTDAEPEEQERTQSIRLGIAPFECDGHRIVLLDAPGYDDFREEALTALRVADLAVLVVDATAGVQTGDVQLWRAAAAMRKPRMVFVTKMDRSRASLQRATDHLREHLGGDGFELVEIPIGEEGAFHGVADLITEHAFLYDTGRGVELDELPDDIADAEHAAHDQLVEDVVSTSDELLERYLDGHAPTPAELEQALHEGVDAGIVFPIMCGAALAPGPDGAPTPMGVDRLLAFITHVGPAPGDVPGPLVRIGQGTDAEDLHEVPCDPDGPLLLEVFATRSDDFVGQISLMRVRSGTLHVDDVVHNPRTGAKERLHGLVDVRGTTTTPVTVVHAGDVVGVTKLADVRTGDTLESGDRGWVVEVPDPLPAVHGVALVPTTASDEDRMGTALAKVLAEDRSLRVTHDDQTRQTVLWGLGDAHVQVALARARRRSGVSLDTEPVRVAYRETITRSVTVEGKHKKQSGGRGQFGVAVVRFEPGEPGEGFTFTSAVVGGAIPKGLIPAVGAGIEEAMARGGLHGFPLVDVRATVVDGKAHSVDSDEMSFKVAGSLALREALPQLGVVVLEPISHVEVTCPVDLQGEVMGDLQQRRGQVQGTRQGEGGDVVVEASVPTAEVLRYAVDLRSLTHGRASFSARHDRYEAVPGHLVASLPTA
jgi:elongation factor G